MHMVEFFFELTFGDDPRVNCEFRNPQESGASIVHGHFAPLVLSPEAKGILRFGPHNDWYIMRNATTVRESLQERG